MSFSEGICILHDDDFEGSNGELRISQEVFYGVDSVAGDERRELNGFINFGCQQHKIVGSSPSSNTGPVTSEVSSKDSSLKDGNNVHGRSPKTSSASFTEGLMLAESDGHAIPAKRIKLSVDELSSFKPYLQKALSSEVPLKAIVSGVDHPNSHLDCQIVMCHVVESSGEGVQSSCYLLKQGVETEKKACFGDRVLPMGNSLGSEGSEGKEIVVSNAMASPVSQESCATKILVAGPAVANVDKTGSRQRAVRKRKKGTPVELDDDDDYAPWTSDCSKELRPLLRRKIFHLLAAAGWSIEKRKRKCRTYEEFVFVSPEERPVRELSKAWSLCGQMLLAHEYKQMEAGDGKEWTNIDQFCSDLSSTLTNMDTELKHRELMAALAHQWILLDPFVKVVFVNRKIQALRAGNEVKAKNDVSDAGENSGVVARVKRFDGRCTMTKLYDSSLASESTVMDYDRQSQGGQVEAYTSRSIYVSEGNCMRLLETVNKIGDSGDVCMSNSRHLYSPSLPACGSDTTSLQPARSLYEVAVDSRNDVLTNGLSKRFSAHWDDASDDVMHGLSQLCAEDTKYRQCFGSSSLRNSGADACLDSKSKGKIPKKSKKISEIELASLSEDEVLNLSTSFRVEDDAQAMNEHTNKANDRSCKKMPTSTKSCRKRTAKMKSFPCQLKDDDLLISAIVQKKRFRSSGSNSSGKAGTKLRAPKRRKSHKSGCRLLPRNLGKGGRHFPDGRWSLVAERTVLSWLLYSGVIFPNEAIQFRDLKGETVLKDGLITRDGILCKCCNKVFSISEFKVHAGPETNRLCSNLFVDSGQPFTLRLLEAWSAEYKARKAGLRSVQSDEFDQNDDSCGLCGDGGELLCCDNCPSTFHQSCLSAEELPEGSWYCASCTCWICGNLVDGEASSASCGFRCCQCEHKYHVRCLKEQGVDRIPSNPWFCSGNCEEVHSGLQSRIGVCNVIADGYSWSALRCIQDDQKVHSAQRFALKAECNSKLAVALTIMEECFVSMVDARTGVDMIPHVVYNWGSEFPRLDYHGFYTMVLEKDDVVIAVASVRVHGVQVAEMPLVATCSKYRRKGMCRRLLSAIEQMLISLKVEKLVVAAIPHLVETWTVGFGFVPVKEEEKKSLNKINLMVFPGTVMLKKTLHSEQIVDLQGAGSAVGVSSVGIDKSIEQGDSSGEHCENKCENDHQCSNEDDGGLNIQLACSYDMEVVGAQMIEPGSERNESRDTDRVGSSGCMSLQVCGDTETSDACDMTPQKETCEGDQNRCMQASYDDIVNGASMDSRVEPCNCLETQKSQECPVSGEGARDERTQHEISFHDSSEVETQPDDLPVSQEGADNFGEQGGYMISCIGNGVEGDIMNCLLPQECSDLKGNEHDVSFEVGCETFNCSVPQELAGRGRQHEKSSDVKNETESKVTTCPVLEEAADHGRDPLEVASSGANVVNCPLLQTAEPERIQARMSLDVAGEVESEDTIPLARHEDTYREKSPHEFITSSVANETECRNTGFLLSQEGADLEVSEIVADLKETQHQAAMDSVNEIESKINVLGDEAHSAEACELPGTCVNGEDDKTVTVREADVETEKVERASLEVDTDEQKERMVNSVCQCLDMVSCDNTIEPVKRLETGFSVESESQEASPRKNSCSPYSSAALESQHGCASDLETQFATDNESELSMMDKLRKLAFWQNSINTSR